MNKNYTTRLWFYLGGITPNSKVGKKTLVLNSGQGCSENKNKIVIAYACP